MVELFLVVALIATLHRVTTRMSLSKGSLTMQFIQSLVKLLNGKSKNDVSK